eukprot:GHVU01176961.1.p1 GENE.GHVU01176961.1~~GHVU01176961.1.p1  ORF type:complete len:145 (+),score=7.25 GHVU01176961.1:735-1169(+)
MNIYILLYIFFKNNYNFFSLYKSSYFSLYLINFVLLETLMYQYNNQNIILNSVYFELFTKKMTSYIQILFPFNSSFFIGDIVSLYIINIINYSYTKHKFNNIFYIPIILGITKLSLATNGFLSSLSFQLLLKNLINYSINYKYE